MATPLAIFDREILVQVLDRECLAETGTSAAIVGAHKVGKTHLLKHICSRALKSQESLFCTIDLDLLRASLGDGETLSDHVFLRFFLSQLVEQIDSWIENQSDEKELWSRDIAKAEQELTALSAVVDPNIQKMRDQRLSLVAALKPKLRQLQGLEKVSGSIHQLVDQKDRLAVYQVVYVFNSLQRLTKRIILIIDEFDQMLREKGFTDGLFSFLRGANNTGKIIALVTSRVHLMDKSLHGDLATPDRLSLFNHFRPQILSPFSPNESIAFLDWFAEGEPPLNPDEKAYLRKLGGGSPYFLKQAREEFLSRGRPATELARTEFEMKYLSPILDDALGQIWNRCVPGEHTTLRQVATGESPDQEASSKLERDGYLIRSDSGTSLFSPLFVEFVKRQPRSPKPVSPPAEPARNPVTPGRPEQQIEVSMTLPYQVIPTSLYFAYPEMADVCKFTVTNNTAEEQVVQLSCELVDYSQETTKSPKVPPGTHHFDFQVILKKDSVSALRDPVATQVRAKAILPSGNGRPLIESWPVRLLPKDNFLMARWNPLTRDLIDYTWLITAWINSNEASLQPIKQRASMIYPALGHKAPSGDKAYQNIREKANALYTALAERKLTYDDQTLVFHQAENDYVQRVRMVSESLQNSVANCLDGAVLFASLLASCDVDPAILLTRGHAIAGWRDQRGSKFNWEFLDVTAFATSSFEDAWEKGQKGYRSAKEYCMEPGGTSLTFDADNFAILIDVRKVWQQRKISPL